MSGHLPFREIPDSSPLQRLRVILACAHLSLCFAGITKTCLGHEDSLPKPDVLSIPIESAHFEFCFDWKNRILAARAPKLGLGAPCVVFQFDPSEKSLKQTFRVPQSFPKACLPERRQILVHNEPLKRWEFYTYEGESAGKIPLECNGPIVTDTSPDGRSIVGNAFKPGRVNRFDQNLFAIDVEKQTFQWGPIGWNPSFVNDEDRICYIEYFRDEPQRITESKLFTSRLDWKDKEAIATFRPPFYGPTLSPGGTMSAGNRMVGQGDKALLRLCIYDWNTGKLKRFDAGNEGDCIEPTFSPRLPELLAYSVIPQDEKYGQFDAGRRGILLIRSLSREHVLSQELRPYSGQFAWSATECVLGWVAATAEAPPSYKYEFAVFTDFSKQE